VSQQSVVRPIDGANELVQPHLNGRTVAVLGVLNQEDHQERDDRRTRIDHELPGIAEAEQRTGDHPTEDHDHGQREAERVADCMGRPLGEVGEGDGRYGRYTDRLIDLSSTL